jgi:hypothetical protein
MALGLGFNSFDEMVASVGAEDFKLLCPMDQCVALSTNWTGFKKSWAAYSKMHKADLKNADKKTLFKTVTGQLPAYLQGVAMTIGKKLGITTAAHDTAVTELKSKVTIAFPGGMTAEATFHTGDAKNNGTLAKPPLTPAEIMMFILSLNFGLYKHPGDHLMTTIADFKTLFENLKNYTSAKYFSVIVFHNHTQSSEIAAVMQESALQNNVEYLVCS